jgi:hypothetical protein
VSCGPAQSERRRPLRVPQWLKSLLLVIASSNLLTKGVATNFSAPKIRSKKIEDVRHDQGGKSVREA